MYSGTASSRGAMRKNLMPQTWPGLDEGVNRAAVLQIAAQAHGQPVHLAPQAVMVVRSAVVWVGACGRRRGVITGTSEYREASWPRPPWGCASPPRRHSPTPSWMVSFRVSPLAVEVDLGSAKRTPCPHPQHGGLEGKVGAGGRLIEQAGHHPPTAGVHKIGGVVHNITAPLVQGLPLRLVRSPKSIRCRMTLHFPF